MEPKLFFCFRVGKFWSAAPTIGAVAVLCPPHCHCHCRPHCRCCPCCCNPCCCNHCGAVHVVIEQQYFGCHTIKPQVLGNRIAIPRMRIERNVGRRRRRSDDHAGGSGRRTAGAPSAHPITMRSKNCTRNGSRWITPLTSLACYAALGGTPMMTVRTT